MSGERLWWLGLAATATAALLDGILGPTYLTIGVAVLAIGLLLLAAIVAPPHECDREDRPW